MDFDKKGVESEIESFFIELEQVKEELSKLKEIFLEIPKILESFKKELIEIKFNLNKTDNLSFTSNLAVNQTNQTLFKPLKGNILDISTGNKGVQTDKQTDKQTDRQEDFNQKITSIKDADLILTSLDSMKKEIRLKLKRLTDQEFLVFSTIYQLEDEKGFANYKNLSKKLNLTESSIREYIRRLLFKGIPIEKVRINNKEVNLSISKNLRKLASLSTILQLKDL